MNPNLVAKYLDNPNQCPHCDSKNLAAELMDAEYKQCWREVQCIDCNKNWREVFNLANIEEII